MCIFTLFIRVATPIAQCVRIFSLCKCKRPFLCISFPLWIGFIEYVGEPKLQIISRLYIALESKLPSDAQRTEASIYQALTFLTWPTFKCRYLTENSLYNIHISTEGYSTTLWWFPCNTTLTALESNILLMPYWFLFFPFFLSYIRSVNHVAYVKLIPLVCIFGHIMPNK